MSGPTGYTADKDASDLINQNVKISEQESLQHARRRLLQVVDPGQYDHAQDYHSDRAVYAAAKAYCILYEKMQGE